MDFYTLFNNYQSAYNALIRHLSKLCKRAIDDYNRNNSPIPNIEQYAIGISRDSNTAIVSVHIRTWLAGGGITVSSEKTADEMEQSLKKFIDKHIPNRIGIFHIYCSIQNITIHIPFNPL